MKLCTHWLIPVVVMVVVVFLAHRCGDDTFRPLYEKGEDKEQIQQRLPAEASIPTSLDDAAPDNHMLKRDNTRTGGNHDSTNEQHCAESPCQGN